LTSTGPFNSPIKPGLENKKVKNNISNIAPIIAKIDRISLRFSEYWNSVNANNHKTTAIGTKIFPIKKYIQEGIPTPLINATIKDIEEGHQGSDIKTQVPPT
jgi:hypothetical protein